MSTSSFLLDHLPIKGLRRMSKPRISPIIFERHSKLGSRVAGYAACCSKLVDSPNTEFPHFDTNPLEKMIDLPTLSENLKLGSSDSPSVFTDLDPATVKLTIASTNVEFPHLDTNPLEKMTDLPTLSQNLKLGSSDSPLVLADLDPATAKLAIGVLGPSLSAFSFLFIARIVMSWYPNLPVGKFPYVLAYAPTEPLLVVTRKVIPPLGGVDVTPVVWFGLVSFLNEILVGPQGLLVLLSQQVN